MSQLQSNSEEKDSPVILKQFFFEKKSLHFHINAARVIRPVKQDKLSFSGIKINMPLPNPAYCIS